jgi:hypothetical protein
MNCNRQRVRRRMRKNCLNVFIVKDDYSGSVECAALESATRILQY